MPLTKHGVVLSVALIERNTYLGSGKMYGGVIIMIATAYVEPRIARPHMQTPAVAVAYLIDNIQP